MVRLLNLSLTSMIFFAPNQAIGLSGTCRRLRCASHEMRLAIATRTLVSRFLLIAILLHQANEASAAFLPLAGDFARSHPGSTAVRRMQVRCNGVTRPRAQTSMMMSLDFDAVRTSMRGAIQFVVAAGGVGVGGVLWGMAKRGGTQPRFDAAALQKWYVGLAAAQKQQLFWCLFLDSVGAAPELLLPEPLGQSLDLLWAPCYAFLLFQTFGDRPFLFKTILAVTGFAEEALPFLSFVPSATVGWLLKSSAERVNVLRPGDSDADNEGKGRSHRCE